MTVDFLRQFCKTLPAVTEDIKWGHDLCFCVGAKMFCVTGLEGPFSASFKVTDEEFEEMSETEGMEPAPYMARHKWILVTKSSALKKKDWERHIRQSYEMVRDKLPKKLRKDLKLD
ncbi:MAG TPA: MmcQ/YjbR family DNA-binding protein [Chryseosolibacter sp.]